MKYWFIILLCIVCSFSLFSQEYDLSGMQGIKDKEILYLEVSGYDITISTQKGQIDNKKTLQSIKKKYKIQEVVNEYTDYELDINNKVIESVLTIHEKTNIKATQLCYILNHTNEHVLSFYFQTHNEVRDITLELAVIKEYLATGLVNYIDDREASSILFAGRKIDLGNSCQWRSPHNIYCRGGQVSWSEFPTFEKAELDLEFRITANENNKYSTILMEEDIDVLFEGIPTIAYRVVYMQQRGNPLVVYYVVEEIRGRYISCILSNYGYNRYDYELSPLLEEFMSIPELPENAYNRFDIPEYEVLTKEEKKTLENDQMSIFEVRTGAWLPMGGLKNRFDVSPSVGFSLGGPIYKNVAMDLLCQFAFPINKQPFEYYHSKEKNDYEITKTDLLLYIGLRARQQITLAKNLYWTTYFGFGANILSTDLEKENPKSDEDKYHSVATLDLSAGFILRYKKVGFFTEFHHSPYSINNKVRNGFGCSAAHIGINICY